MKKLLITITIVSMLILSLGSFVFAADTNEVPQWFKDMVSWRKDQVNQAVKDGNITKEQAQAWNEHMDYMEKQHLESGFGFNGQGFGACHGGGFGRGFGQRSNYRGGFGPGMMNGWQNY